MVCTSSSSPKPVFCLYVKVKQQDYEQYIRLTPSWACRHLTGCPGFTKPACKIWEVGIHPFSHAWARNLVLSYRSTLQPGHLREKFHLVPSHLALTYLWQEAGFLLQNRAHFQNTASQVQFKTLHSLWALLFSLSYPHKHPVQLCGFNLLRM